MSPNPDSHLRRLTKGALVGWTVLLVMLVGYMLWSWLVPDREKAPGGFVFMAFGFIALTNSICYFVGFFVLAVPTYFLLILRYPWVRPWHWAVVGGMLFTLIVPAWSTLVIKPTGADFPFAICQTFAAGFAACLTLARLAKSPRVVLG